MMNEKTNMNNLFERIDLIIYKLENLEKLFSENKQSNVKFSDDNLDIDELSKYLYRSKKSIYKMVERAQIPCTKKVGKLYFSKNDIDNWLKSGKKQTKSEIEENALNNILNRRIAQRRTFN